MPHLFVLLFLLVLSCSKDVETFRDAVLTEDINSLEDQTDSNNENINQDENQDSTKEDFESRVTVFPALQDVYLQNGIGYNQEIIRLQENFRRSYLQFDLSQIDTIGGTITSAVLEFIIDTDDGNGIIQLFKGNSNEWLETDFSIDSAPEENELLGEVEQNYNVEEKVRINLDTDQLLPEVSTLVLIHKNGDDLAFASKENKFKLGARLLVEYDSPAAAKTIIIEDSQNIEEEPEEEETTEEETTEEETTEEETTQNIAPTAIAEANHNEGEAPLQVSFNGSKSSDDKGISSYLWNFKDGSSSSLENPTHTFNTPGSYIVELVVKDENGLTDMDTVTITVKEPKNEAPVARASANITVGKAPLNVNFTGSDSSDDQAIDSYLWKFKDGSTSNLSNPSHTFNTPGIYYVDLFVSDAQGLTDFVGITITVEEEIDYSCNTNGGFAGDSGLKTWCWGDIDVPSGSSSGRDSFSQGQLALSVECSANQVVKEGNRLKFVVNPTSPAAASWCNNNYNLRSEIRTMPWNIDLPSGTEEWIGFSYGFGDSYVADPVNNWVFYQAHEGSEGKNPLISLQVNSRATNNHKTGEIVVVNAAHEGTYNIYHGTNVIPKAGETVDIVLHIIWADDNTGLLEVWINGNKLVDEQTRTVYRSSRVGGNSKFGIYKASWRSASGIQNSANHGVRNLETFMGPLRIITRKSNDSNYRKYSYNDVVPR